MRLKKELAKVRAQNAADNRKATVSRDYSIGGLPPDTSHKPINSSNDVPDVVLLPKHKEEKKRTYLSDVIICHGKRFYRVEKMTLPFY